MMTGKIKNLNYSKLSLLLLFTALYISLIFKNFYILAFFSFSYLISAINTKLGIGLISKLNLFQNVREEGPDFHKIKNTTPTMGGLFFIPIFLVIILSSSIFLKSLKLFLFFITLLCFFLIGFSDDYLSCKKKKNTGLTSKQKIFLQFISSLGFLLIAYKAGYITGNISIFNNLSIDIKSIIIPLSLITVVGCSNAANLTDGLDGLASGCSGITFLGLGTEILLRNNEDYIILALFCFSMSGLCLGFLKYNNFPAKIFMGDTGSLSIGAAIGIICVYTNSFYSTLIMAGIFLIETLSVIIQVLYFKFTKRFLSYGKKIFLMSPLHHHYELLGYKEEKIVETFWKANIILVFLGIVFRVR